MLFQLKAFKDSRSPLTQAALVSVILILLVFPDVIFMRASISLAGFFTGQQLNRKVVCLYPEPHHRQWQHAFYDTSGALFQSEPMQQFMTYSLWHHESPYWNPYSGCGQMGPETLVDLKFSFFTLLMALLGGSQLAYHVITLSLFGLAVFFLFLCLNRYFKLTFLASVGACVVYLLNGYTVANLGSNTAQVYLYFPPLLFALCAFARSPSVMRFAGLMLVDGIILSTTFLPTSCLLLVATYATGGAYLISLNLKRRSTLKPGLVLIFLLQCLAAFLALGVLSFIYLPVIESTKVVGEMSQYAGRHFYPANVAALLSFFSPKHFFDAYPYATPSVLFSGLPENPSFRIGNGMFHVGVLPAVLAASALTLKRSWRTPLLVTLVALLVISLGRIFGIPLISDLIDLVFGLRNIGEQYWFQVVAVAVPLLVGFGIDAVRLKSRFEWLPPLLVYTVLTGAVVYVWQNYGIREHPGYVKTSVSFLLAMVPVSAILVYLVKRRPYTASAMYCLLMVAMIFVELTHNAIHYRYVRNEYFKRPPEAIRFLQDNTGLYRIANLGSGLIPAEFGSAFQIQQVESLNMNVLPAYKKFFDSNFLKDPTTRWCVFPTMFCFRDNTNLDMNISMFDALSVKYVVANKYWPVCRNHLEKRGYKLVQDSQQWLIYENPYVYPRIFAVPHIIEAGIRAKQLSLRDTAFTSDATLLKLAKNAGLTVGSYKLPLPSIPDNAVKFISYHHDNLSTRATLAQPALIVLMDNWHPNWKATIDGVDAYIGIVNGSFRGVVMPAGTHTLVMRYVPGTLSAAKLIACICILVLACAFVYRRHIDRFAQRISPHGITHT